MEHPLEASGPEKMDLGALLEEYGDRLLMLDHGTIVLDRAGKEKEATSTEELLQVFNRYSIL